MKTQLIKLLLLLVLTSVLSGEAFALTYYVSPSGLDSNIGSKSKPFKTIQKAANIVNPGDTVIVRDGVYKDLDGDKKVLIIKRGGTKGKLGSDQYGNNKYDPTTWVTFKSENKFGAVIDGNFNKSSHCVQSGPYANYVRLESFEIKECSSVGVHFSNSFTGNNWYIYNNHIHNNGLRSKTVRWEMNNFLYGKCGLYVGTGADSVTIDGNIIHHNGRNDDPSRWSSATGYEQKHEYFHDHGIYVGVSNNKASIINNVFYEHHHGFHLKLNKGTSNAVIFNNVFHGKNKNLDANPSWNWGGALDLVHGGSNYGLSNILIDSNTFHDPTLNYVVWSYPFENYNLDIVLRNNKTTSGKILDPHITGGRWQLDNNKLNSVFPLYECLDGVDNDGDGNIDYPSDIKCSSITDNDESTYGGDTGATSKTYYVSPSGLDSNIGSKSKPFKTIQKAADIVNPGDTVIVRDGIYSDTNNDKKVVRLTRGGSAEGGYVTFKSENRWGAIIDGKSDSVLHGFFVQNDLDYFKIEDFEIRELKISGIHMGNNNRCNFVEINGNNIHHISNTKATDQYEMDSKIYGRVGIYVSFDKNVTINRNSFHHIGRKVDSANWKPAPGSIYDKPGSSVHAYIHDHGIYSSRNDNLSIINNIYYENHNGWHIKVTDGSSNVLIINNTTFGGSKYIEANMNKHGGAVEISNQSGVGTVENVLIQNNIFFKPTNDIAVWSWPLQGFSGVSNLVVKNNATTTPSGRVLSPYITTGDFRELNNVSGISTDSTLFFKETKTFALLPGIDFINSGLIANSPKKDFNNKFRLDGAPDLGATEYFSINNSKDFAPKLIKIKINREP